MGVEFENLDKPIKNVSKMGKKSWVVFGAIGVGLLVLLQNKNKGTSTTSTENSVTTAESYALLQSAEQSILSQVTGKLSNVESQFSHSLHEGLGSLIDTQNEQFTYLKDDYEKQLTEMQKQVDSKINQVQSAKTSSVTYYYEPVQETKPVVNTDNQNKYLDNLVATGSQGNQIWAMQQKDQLNGTNNAHDFSQKIYLNNLVNNGTYGQSEWAKAELKKMG